MHVGCAHGGGVEVRLELTRASRVESAGVDRERDLTVKRRFHLTFNLTVKFNG